MKKEEVKKKAVELQQLAVDNLIELYNQYKVDADIDENETRDPEDFSHQDESTEMSQNVELQLQQARFDLEKLKSVELAPNDTIALGSLVQTDKGVFYISIPFHPFEMAGKHVVGVSTAAPIYQSMENKKQGDSFSFAGKEYAVVAVS